MSEPYPKAYNTNEVMLLDNGQKGINKMLDFTLKSKLVKALDQ